MSRAATDFGQTPIAIMIASAHKRPYLLSERASRNSKHRSAAVLDLNQKIDAGRPQQKCQRNAAKLADLIKVGEVYFRTLAAIVVGLSIAKALTAEVETTRLGFAFRWRKLKARRLVCPGRTHLSPLLHLT